MSFSAPFHGDRVQRAAAEEQGVVLVGEALGEFMDHGIEREGPLDERGQLDQPRHETALALGVRAVMFRQSDHEHGRAPSSCVVNALVDATPISGPARVSMTSSDSRTSELSGALQIESVERYPDCLASRRAASVSAVSPDWEMVTNRELRGTSGLR